MKMCFLFSERRRKREGKRKERDKKNGDAVALLPSESWTHRPFLDTAVKG